MPLYSSVPDITTYTWVNQGTSTAIQSTPLAGVLMVIQPNASLNWRGLFHTQPATPYRVRAQPIGQPQTLASAYTHGIYFYDGTKLLGWETLTLGTGQSPRVERITNVNTDGSTVFGGSGYPFMIGDVGSSLFYQFRNDGTTLSFDVSRDGVNYLNTYSELVGTFITPTQIGYGGVNQTAANTSWLWMKNFVIQPTAALN